MHISTRSSKEELLFFSDPSHLERSIRKEKRTTSIDTTSTTSIDSSTRTSIDTNPRADMVATLVLQRDENGDLHELEGHMCNAVGQKIDGQWTAILEPFAAIEDAKVPRQRTLADLIWPRQFYTNRIDQQQQESVDRQHQKSSDRQPPIPYRVRLPDLDAHRLKATRNPSQTSVCLKTPENISQQFAEAPKQEQSTLSDTSFVESVDRRHIPCIDRHQTDGDEPTMERQSTKE
ncbi:hypothetical protein F2Q68_00014946 [Brassica cretica]|uniref:Uncharacterized protein n=2 Tax=Brassica cretica TaxID=69181 RepID=A0ABQ7EZI9_BRACR|nr:hypothetical protein F2Q68_00014946 [Brassica cretica]KAF3609042.1 hypothetical protein DY000_02047690 [Brassica cretica]